MKLYQVSVDFDYDESSAYPSIIGWKPSLHTAQIAAKEALGQAELYNYAHSIHYYATIERVHVGSTKDDIIHALHSALGGRLWGPPIARFVAKPCEKCDACRSYDPGSGDNNPCERPRISPVPVTP